MTLSCVTLIINRGLALFFTTNDVYSYAGALIKPSSAIHLLGKISLRNLHRRHLKLVTVTLPYTVGRQALSGRVFFITKQLW